MSAASLVLLTLMLNGKPVDLPHPIFALPEAPPMGRQVVVPVRDVFEAMGFVVQVNDDEQRSVTITGYVDRLPRRQLLRIGTLVPGEPTVTAHEYSAALPAPPTAVDGCLYVSLVAVRIIAGCDVRVDLESKALRCDLVEPEDAPALTVGELMSDLAHWMHRRVRVRGEYIGTGGDTAWPATSMGAPAPGAWAIRDETGAIYCADILMLGIPYPVDPELSAGERYEVGGVVRPGWGGVPYLSQAEARSIQSDQ
jgi:hypothetical protein